MPTAIRRKPASRKAVPARRVKAAAMVRSAAEIARINGLRATKPATRAKKLFQFELTAEDIALDNAISTAAARNLATLVGVT